MSDHAEDVKFSLKVLINKQKTKVLFAEVDNNFADVLISFMTLPLGAIVRVLKNHYGKEALVLGSLTSLYNGLSNLDSDHFWTEGCKEVLLNPKSSFGAECRKLKLDISDTQPTEYFTCENRFKYDCEGRSMRLRCLSVYYDTATCFCEKTMKREADLNDEYSQAVTDGGVFTLKTTSFIISDDLQISPNTKGFIEILKDFGINEMDVVDPINVTFGFNEIMDLLKGSLFSLTPLSDIILNRSHVKFGGTSSESEQGILYRHKTEKEANSNSYKKMVLKVILQKSTNKILFAQSDEGFVDFLCSLLAIPLGGAECLLGGKTRLQSIDNIYRSIAEVHYKYLFHGEHMKDKLMKPKLPHGYITKDPILPLIEESYPSAQYYSSSDGTIIYSSENFFQEQGEYMRGSKMYKITDDLTVTPFCMTSIISDLKELKIPLSNIKELELEIRSEEALRILKASFTSTSALTDAVITDSIVKQTN